LFISAPGLVQFLHPSQVAPRQSYAPAITLSMEWPWYLLVYDVAYKGQRVSQTSLVAWDATLVELLAQIPQADLRGIARLDRRRELGPSWAFRWIGELWASSSREAQAVGPLLIKFDDDRMVRDTRLVPVPDEPGRRLLHVASHSLAGVR
jgi:hypothetical protein